MKSKSLIAVAHLLFLLHLMSGCTGVVSKQCVPGTTWSETSQACLKNSVVKACQNGRNNPPACDQCVDQTRWNESTKTCEKSCANGSNDWPDCDACSASEEGTKICSSDLDKVKECIRVTDKFRWQTVSCGTNANGIKKYCDPNTLTCIDPDQPKSGDLRCENGNVQKYNGSSWALEKDCAYKGCKATDGVNPEYGCGCLHNIPHGATGTIQDIYGNRCAEDASCNNGNLNVGKVLDGYELTDDGQCKSVSECQHGTTQPQCTGYKSRKFCGTNNRWVQENCKTAEKCSPNNGVCVPENDDTQYYCCKNDAAQAVEWVTQCSPGYTQTPAQQSSCKKEYFYCTPKDTGGANFTCSPDPDDWGSMNYFYYHNCAPEKLTCYCDNLYQESSVPMQFFTENKQDCEQQCKSRCPK